MPTTRTTQDGSENSKIRCLGLNRKVCPKVVLGVGRLRQRIFSFSATPANSAGNSGRTATRDTRVSLGIQGRPSPRWYWGTRTGAVPEAGLGSGGYGRPSGKTSVHWVAPDAKYPTANNGEKHIGDRPTRPTDVSTTCSAFGLFHPFSDLLLARRVEPGESGRGDETEGGRKGRVPVGGLRLEGIVMPGLPRGWFVEMEPDDCGIICDDCKQTTFTKWRWNNNRRAKIRRLCLECFQARFDHQNEHRFGLVNPVERL